MTEVLRPDRRRVHARRWWSAAIVVVGTFLLAWVSPWTEALGATTGAVCVWLAAVSDPWTWPIGIANNLLYLVVFWESGLYADASLQLVYAAISVYGIVRWTTGRGAAAVRPISRGGRRELGATAVAVVVAAVGLFFLLSRATNSQVPAWDGTTTAMSLGAQWLLSRRVLENWWLWIAVDVVYVPLYLWKGLWVTAGLYALFLALCILGLADWKREMRTTAASAGAAPAAV
jgi:nicotinamide mononucleotide transporter